MPVPATSTSPAATPSAIALLTVSVVPDATLNTGSPDTVIGLLNVMLAVVISVAGTVLEPTSASPPLPSAEAEPILNTAPLSTSVPPL